ncbi:glutamate receptor ionotropic, delta-2 isoform X4 [Orussus abietinus]|uniref:glutamate receptor ionotropic, delta-2 isoform X4 n=1 Tax=Orussus abietinus TaxID=222816 RepID=UPI0006262C47|nr:glutamate receptor ionotropic, delta-2 isoform X4 [Orussus abietinus]
MPFSGVVKRNGTLVGVGYAFELLEMVRSKVPFDYTIVLPEEDGLGNEKNGITSLVERKEVDMVVAFVPVIPEYWRYFKYGTTLDEVEWTVLMGRPSESASGSGLLAPFDTVVWSLVLVSVLVVGPVVYLLVSLRAKLAKAEKPERYSLATCMWFVYGALLKQGSTVSPVSDSARLLFAAWWIFVTILTSFYTANLTAFLTLSEFKLPIDSLGDLVNKNLQWSMPKGRSIDVVLQEKLPDKELEVLGRSKFPWRSGLIDLSAESTEDILKRIDKQRVLLGGKHLTRRLIFEDYKRKTRSGLEEAKRCSFATMPRSIRVERRAFVFPWDSDIDELINERMERIVQAGILKHLEILENPSVEICPLNLGSKERQLRNSDLFMTYKVVVVGFAVATLLFGVELLVRACTRRDSGRASLPPPPPGPLYRAIRERHFGKTHLVNGREYYAVAEKDGSTRLVPLRTPSAVLFHYAA